METKNVDNALVTIALTREELKFITILVGLTTGGFEDSIKIKEPYFGCKIFERFLEHCTREDANEAWNYNAYELTAVDGADQNDT